MLDPLGALQCAAPGDGPTAPGAIPRDPDLRRRQGIRNTLWSTWLLRPLGSAIRRTTTVVRRMAPDVVTPAGQADVCRGVAWGVRSRRPIPAAVERMYAAVDRVQFDSGARCYVS